MRLNIVNPKRFIIFVSTLILILISIISGIAFLLKNKKESNKGIEDSFQIYETLVQISDQTADDPREDERNLLNAGDVIAILPKGHNWSETEKASYLILRLKLAKEDADKLLQPETKEIEPRDEQKRPRMETIRARKYRIKMESLGFDFQKFRENPVQPYPEEIFDSSMIEEKL